MPRQSTIHDVLLSCPGDVAYLKQIVSECIDDFNSLHGANNSTSLQLRHWSKDSYPKSGGNPQQLLNDIFIHDCDACIALFGNTFGSPTENYASGTEEEIEDMLISGKQVFMYFIESPCDPSTIDLKQLEKVREFKEKYSKKGIYEIVKDKSEFKRKLLNDISLHFLGIISSSEGNLKNTNLFPRLAISIGEQNFFNSNFSQTKRFEGLKENCENLITKIKLIEIDIPQAKIKQPHDLFSGLSYEDRNPAAMQVFTQFTGTPIQIDNKIKEIIKKYSSDNQIEIKDSFWEIGNLREREDILTRNKTIIGDEQGKQKYEFILDLYKSIKTLIDCNSYFLNLDDYLRLACYIENSGTMVDEDIDIIITVPKGKLLLYDEFPIPKEFAIEYITEAFEVFFVSKETYSIGCYQHKKEERSLPIYSPHANPIMTNLFQSEKSYEDFQEDYLDEVKKHFIYKKFQTQEHDILKFNISELKHNTKMFFPTHILFLSKPNYIEFKICSKNTPKEITKKIEFI